MIRRIFVALFAVVGTLPALAGTDHFLTIGGGGGPYNNQASLERNVVFFRRVLTDVGLAAAPHTVYFACGLEKIRDLQYWDPNAKIPRANLLLARLFGGDQQLYQNYREHNLPDLSGPANRASLNKWFAGEGAKLVEGDRLFIYFTGHGGGGGPKTPRNTTMDLWFDGGMTVKDFTALLDKLNPKVRVVLIMVQCHSGGFGDVIFKNADAGPALAEPVRAGFFATWHDRLAAGCTPDTVEENYKDYTTYFFAALTGKTRTGATLAPPDYDGDGKTSMAEAHAYVLLTSDTIDIPMCTSDVLLRQFSKTKADAKAKDVVTASTRFDDLLKRATPDRRAVLEGLSKALDLKGDDRAAAARALAETIEKQRKALDAPGGGGRGGRNKERNDLRNQIKARVLARWPEMVNAFHPATQNALNAEADQVVKLIESDPAYKRWNELSERDGSREDKSFDLERKWVKCQRFLYVAETVALEANLGQFANPAVQERFKAIRAAENGTVGTRGGTVTTGTASH
jgi:hypothetical protein